MIAPCLVMISCSSFCTAALQLARHRRRWPFPAPWRCSRATRRRSCSSPPAGRRSTGCEPTARNSNLLPVKANGLVRLRSPASLGSGGSVSTPTVSVPLALRRLRAALLDLLEHVGELIAQEDRDDRRRGFVRAQAMIVAGRGHDGPQQAWHTCAPPESRRRRTRRNCALSCGVSPGSSRLPCVLLPSDQFTCLPEPLMPANGFSCSRHAMPYFSATLLQRHHDQLLMVGGDVGVFVDRGDFVLRRSDFVVPRLHRNAELEQLALDFEHEGQHALGDRAEVMIFELLPLRRLGAEQRAAGVEQVGPGEEEVAVDQEVFLLGTGGRGDECAVRCGRTASASAGPAR